LISHAFGSTFAILTNQRTDQKLQKSYQANAQGQTSTTEENNEPLTRVWQKWRFRSPQTVLWLIKHGFSASSLVVKIATFAKPETVISHFKKTIC